MLARSLSKLKINRLPIYEEVESEKPFGGAELLTLFQNVLSMEASFRFRAKGLSKSPFFRDGDVINISPLQGTSPDIGDFVTFIHPKIQSLSIERIMGKNDDSYLIRAPGTGGWVPRENILGYLNNVKKKGSDRSRVLEAKRMVLALLTRISSLILPAWKLARRPNI